VDKNAFRPGSAKVVIESDRFPHKEDYGDLESYTQASSSTHEGCPDF
jgi:hypothetical protein